MPGSEIGMLLYIRNMVYYWILIASWLGLASLQYIKPTGSGSENLMDPLDSTVVYPPLPYVNYFNFPVRNYELNDERNHIYEPDNLEIQRKRRTAEVVSDDRNKRWRPFIDSDKALYFRNQEKNSPLVVEALSGEDNSTDTEILDAVEKRSFSPWGGKRDKPNVAEHMWTWKRTSSIREPSMPKRVRFSPWGGKRSGQMIYKPGTKSSKIIFSASVPELTRIVSNFSPSNNRLNVASFQFVPTLDKRHPIKILTLSTKMEDRIREALPFNTFIDNLPKMYKPGHPYLDVSLKKDGKRKVKFSAWGGKRSPPIIGPIWTPASEDAKDSTLDTMVLVRNNRDEDEINGL